MVERRTFLKVGGMAAIGYGVTGCAARSAKVATPLRRPVTLPPVRASWDRVIRTTVGLRPHRPAGFVLRADKLDDRMLVHNYGHGGAGMSLSWGTGAMAADLALQQPERRAAVIGSGVVGLTTARQLQRRGFDVTIYAMSVPPDTTSNMSLARFTPVSGLVETEQRTPAWDAQFHEAGEIAFRQLQLLVGRGYGVSWLDNYNLSDELRPPRQNEGGPPPLRVETQTERIDLKPGEHPFPTRYATLQRTIRMEPSVYLDALVRDVLLFGGHIVIRKFESPRDVMTVPERVIVNCTGLGSRALFDDQSMVPLKGQLTELLPQPEVTYGTTGPNEETPGDSVGIHMNPRGDGIALGGTSERGVWTMEPNQEEMKRVVEGHIKLFGGMKTTSRG